MWRKTGWIGGAVLVLVVAVVVAQERGPGRMFGRPGGPPGGMVNLLGMPEVQKELGYETRRPCRGTFQRTTFVIGLMKGESA